MTNQNGATFSFQPRCKSRTRVC